MNGEDLKKRSSPENQIFARKSFNVHFFELTNLIARYRNLCSKNKTKIGTQVKIRTFLQKSSSSHVGSGIVPIDGVSRILYGHCFYYASPFSSITCILFHQSIFLHLILYLLFPRLFRSSSSSTTTYFQFQSLDYHIFIFFPQNMTVSRILLASAILSEDFVMPNMSISSSLFLRSNSCTPHIARFIALSVLLKIAISSFSQAPCFTFVQHS